MLRYTSEQGIHLSVFVTCKYLCKEDESCFKFCIFLCALSPSTVVHGS